MLGGSPEGQRSPGRLGMLQEGSLKDVGAGCLHVPKDEPVGKKTSLRELWLNSVKKRIYNLRKKERLEVCCEVMQRKN